MAKVKISVGEALKKVESGQSIQDYTIDFENIKIESLDVMKLVKGGFKVPENAIYYDEDAITEDDSDYEWKEIDYDPLTKTEIKIALKDDIRNWVETEKINLNKLLENLLEGFYKSQKLIHKD